MMAAEVLPRAPLAARLRVGKPEDLDYVRSSWRKSNAHTAESRRIVAYSVSMRRFVDRILARNDTALTVACDVEDEDALYGWAATKAPDTLYFLFVRFPMRGRGLARRLVEAAGLVGNVHYTHRPTMPVKVPEGWAYDPYRNWPE